MSAKNPLKGETMAVETCAVCGCELYMVHGLVSGAGEYFHDFSKKDAKEKYTFIHLPVPVLKDDLFVGEREPYVPAQGWSGEFRKANL